MGPSLPLSSSVPLCLVALGCNCNRFFWSFGLWAIFLCPNLFIFSGLISKVTSSRKHSLVSSYQSTWMKLIESYCMDHCLPSIICAYSLYCFLDCEFLILRIESGSGSGSIFVSYSPLYQEESAVDSWWRASHEGPELGKAALWRWNSAHISKAIQWPPSHWSTFQSYSRYCPLPPVFLSPKPHCQLLTIVLLAHRSRLPEGGGNHKQQVKSRKLTRRLVTVQAL